MLINNLTKLNTPSRNAMSAALIIIASVAMYNWILAPHVTYLFAVQRYEPVIGSIATENETLCRALEDKRKQLNQLRQQFARLQSTIFTMDQARQFLTDMQDIAEKTGCTVTSINYSQDQPGPVIKQGQDMLFVLVKGAKVGLLAPYNSIVALLETLESYPQKVWVDSVAMESIGTDSERLKVTISLTIYCMRNKESALNE
jgi:hypothetical protein